MIAHSHTYLRRHFIEGGWLFGCLAVVFETTCRKARIDEQARPIDAAEWPMCRQRMIRGELQILEIPILCWVPSRLDWDYKMSDGPIRPLLF